MLDQAEAERLMRVEKMPMETKDRVFPGPKEEIRIELISRDGQDRFILDIHRKYVREFNCTYQEREDKREVLVRLDMCQKTHRNPRAISPPAGFEGYSGAVLKGPHLHLYVQEYGDRWAMPASVKGFVEPQTPEGLTDNLSRFLDLCNIIGDLHMGGVLA